jgi:hypothetical protein
VAVPKPSGVVEERALESDLGEVFTKIFSARGAVFTTAARPYEASHHVVVWRHFIYAGSNLLNDAGSLVASSTWYILAGIITSVGLYLSVFTCGEKAYIAKQKKRHGWAHRRGI